MPTEYELMPPADEEGSQAPLQPGERPRASVLASLNEDRIMYLDQQMRKRAASLLFVGAVSGLAGIFFVSALGLHRVYTSDYYNLNGEGFPSGEIYFPACISEMVYDPDTPSGKAFIAFMLIAAICMLVSWYPYQLRNVYIKARARPAHLCVAETKYTPTWNDLRVFFPPIGLMLVALIQSTPEGLMGYRENIAEQIHANGAMAMIGSHCIFEFYALAMGQLEISTAEKAVRWILSVLSLFFGVSFAITCQLYSRATDLGICCKDVWVVPNATNAEAAAANGHVYIGDLDYHRLEYGKKMLVDSAYGWGLILKQMEFASEVLSVLFFALGLLAIWFFCEEREVENYMGDLPSLLPPQDAPAQKTTSEEQRM
jgi:hypothetical protein